MKADGKSFEFMYEEDDVYKIPYFQRPYVWNMDNWEDLFDDLVRTNGHHFLGSVILKGRKKPNHYVVIDGQQRITTISLLLKAIHDVLSHKNKLLNTGYEDIKNALFVNKQKKWLLRLEHSHLDRDKYAEIIGAIETNKKDIAHDKISSAKYDKIVEELKTDIENCNSSIQNGKKEKKIRINNSNLIQSCYKYFLFRLMYRRDDKTNLWVLKPDYTQANKILEALFKFNIFVIIDIEENEQEQAIFDTINSAGMELSSTDIIKNALFEKLSQFITKEEDLLKFYDDTWQRTFEDTDAVRDWWSEKRSIGRYKKDNTEILLHSVGIIKGIFNVEKQTIADLANAYKEKIKTLKSKEEIQELINIIIQYANIYKNLVPQFDPSTPISFSEAKNRLSCIMAVSENTTFTPYVIFLYSLYKDDEKLLLKKLYTVEKILMHYLITGQSNKNFNKYCYQLVLKEQSNDEKALNEYLASEVDKFKNSNLQDGLKNVSNKIGKLLLYMIELHRLEQPDSKSDIQGTALDYKKERELEHILPQKWESNQDWKSQVIVDADDHIIPPDENPDDYRSSMVYSIGNMTLLKKSLNSSVSNSIFDKKYNGETGKNNGMKKYIGLSISKEIVEHPYCKKENGKYIWDESCIAKREKDLADEIIKMWGCDK